MFLPGRVPPGAAAGPCCVSCTSHGAGAGAGGHASCLLSSTSLCSTTCTALLGRFGGKTLFLPFCPHSEKWSSVKMSAFPAGGGPQPWSAPVSNEHRNEPTLCCWQWRANVRPVGLICSLKGIGSCINYPVHLTSA